MFTKVDHIGVVVKDLDAATARYVDMFQTKPWDLGVLSLTDIGVKVVLLPIGNTYIELIEPIAADCPAAVQLRERGEGIFHLSIFCEDFDREVERLKKSGYNVEMETTRQLFPGHTLQFAWLLPPDTHGVRVEVVNIDSMPSFAR